MKRPYRQHGFTLLELLVATGLAAAAVAIASMAMVTQNNAMYAVDQTRGANGAGREAILQIEESLRRLGWGIDPRYAIDFKYGNCATQPQPCRDSTSASDELVFVARNPNYRWLNNGDPGCSLAGGCFFGRAWPVTSVTTGGSPSTLTITPQATNTTTVTTMPGQVVLATCAGGQNPVMLTLSQSYTISGISAVLLTPDSTNMVPYNDYASLAACHGQSGAALFLVDRFRYFIQTFGSSPWLMLDTGVDLNNDSTRGNTPDLIPVAKNVEDMQVAYAIPPLPGGCVFGDLNNHNGVLGDDPSNSTAEEPTFSTVGPLYTTSSIDATRCNLWAGNVRSIRVVLRIRAGAPDRSRPGWAGDSIPYPENRSGNVQVAGYRQYTAETSINLRNLDSKTPFIY
jgi:type IV pilus assembly protein PilW